VASGAAIFVAELQPIAYRRIESEAYDDHAFHSRRVRERIGGRPDGDDDIGCLSELDDLAAFDLRNAGDFRFDIATHHAGQSSHRAIVVPRHEHVRPWWKGQQFVESLGTRREPIEMRRRVGRGRAARFVQNTVAKPVDQNVGESSGHIISGARIGSLSGRSPCQVRSAYTKVSPSVGSCEDGETRMSSAVIKQAPGEGARPRILALNHTATCG
jgi:hypothetical protein